MKVQAAAVLVVLEIKAQDVVVVAIALESCRGSAEGVDVPARFV